MACVFVNYWKSIVTYFAPPPHMSGISSRGQTYTTTKIDLALIFAINNPVEMFPIRTVILS